MIRLTGLSVSPERLHFAPGGQLVGVSRPQVGPERAVWWELAAGEVVRESVADALGLSPDGRFLAVRESATGVTVFDGPTPLGTVRVARGRDHASVAVAPDGDGLFTVHRDHVFWHALPGGAEVLRKPRAGASQACYSPGGRWAFAAGRGAVRFWDRHAGNKLLRVCTPARGPAVAVGGDDRTAAVNGDRDAVIAVRDLVAGRTVAELVHPQLVTAAAVSPDGGRVLTGDIAGAVRVWDAAAGRELVAFDFGTGLVTALAVAPDGLTAAVAGVAVGCPVVVWDL